MAGGKIVVAIEAASGVTPPSSGNMCLVVDTDNILKYVDYLGTISPVSTPFVGGVIALPVSDYLTGSTGGGASRLDMNYTGSDGNIALTTDGATGAAGKLTMSSTTTVLANSVGSLSLSSTSAILTNTLKTELSVGSNTAILNSSSFAVTHSTLINLIAPTVTLTSGSNTISITGSLATLAHATATSLVNGSNTFIINSSSATLTHGTAVSIVAPAVSCTVGSNGALINSSVASITHGTVINMVTPTFTIGYAPVASFNATLTKIDATTINIGDPTLNSTTTINIGTNSTTNSIVIGNGPALTGPTTFLYSTSTFSSATLTSYVGSASLAVSTVGSATTQGWELIGSASYAKANTTHNVNTVIGSLVEPIVVNTSIISNLFGSVNNLSYSYAGAATTTLAVGTYSYPSVQNVVSASWSIGTYYNFYSEYPVLEGVSGALAITKMFGFYAPDYSLAGTSITTLRDGTLTSITPTNIWALYLNGTQGTTGFSYIGNGLGIGFASAPTANSQITALLHIGAGSLTTPALKFATSTLTTTPQGGAVEYDGSRLYISVSSSRKTLAFTTDVIYKQLGKLSSANLNTTADQIISLSGGTAFIVTDVVVTNASTSITTAAGAQWWTGASQTGNKIANDNATTLAQLVASTNYVSKDPQTGTKNITINASNSVAGTSLYFSLQTPQGTVATCDIYVYGYILS